MKSLKTLNRNKFVLVPLLTALVSASAFASTATPYVIRVPIQKLVITPRTPTPPVVAPAALVLVGPTGSGALTFAEDFIGTSQFATVYLQNTGGTAAPLATGAISATSPFSVTTTNCGATLAPAGTCSVTVGFTPTAAQSFSGLLSATSDTSSASLNLTGSGKAYPAALSITDSAGAALSSLTFADQAADEVSTAKTFVVKNTGGTDAVLASPKLVVAAPFALASTTCDASIPAGGSCSFSVTFKPSAVQNYTGLATVNSNAAANPSVSLSGKGFIKCDTTPRVYDYTGADQTVTVPASCDTATVKSWGGGGGGMSNIGGGGGYAGATLSVTPGATFTMRVGAGGALGTVCYNTCGGDAYPAGWGGGMTEVLYNGTSITIAGGGGGAGGRGSSSVGAAGGAGGGLAGLNGGNAYGAGGLSGTQTAGGGASSGAIAGAALKGGYGSEVTTPAWNYGGGAVAMVGWAGNGTGGGGGGGWFGGGGGARGGAYNGGGGGGGGSGHLGTGVVGTLTAGSGAVPGNSTDSARGTAGNAGNGSAGQPGRIVVTFTQTQAK